MHTRVNQSAASLIIQRIENGIGYSTSWARGWLLAGRACFAAPHAPQYMVEKGVSALFYHSGGWGPVLHLSTAVGLRTWCRPSFAAVGGMALVLAILLNFKWMLVVTVDMDRE